MPSLNSLVFFSLLLFFFLILPEMAHTLDVSDGEAVSSDCGPGGGQTAFAF